MAFHKQRQKENKKTSKKGEVTLQWFKHCWETKLRQNDGIVLTSYNISSDGNLPVSFTVLPTFSTLFFAVFRRWAVMSGKNKNIIFSQYILNSYRDRKQVASLFLVVVFFNLTKYTCDF